MFTSHKDPLLDGEIHFKGCDGRYFSSRIDSSRQTWGSQHIPLGMQVCHVDRSLSGGPLNSFLVCDASQTLCAIQVQNDNNESYLSILSRLSWKSAFQFSTFCLFGDKTDTVVLGTHHGALVRRVIAFHTLLFFQNLKTNLGHDFLDILVGQIDAG